MIKLEGNFLYDEDSKTIKFNNKKIYNDSNDDTASVKNDEVCYTGAFASILALFISGNTDEAIDLFSSKIASELTRSINNGICNIKERE